MYLVDTNIISTAAPAKRAGRNDIVAWMDRNAHLLFVSAITIAEIEDGIAKSRRLGATRKAEALALWLETLLHLYGQRVLSFGLPSARITGALSDLARSKGFDVGFPDLAIAATARNLGLTILTRNLRHFAPLEVSAFDPFVRLPAG